MHIDSIETPNKIIDIRINVRIKRDRIYR